MLIVRRRKWFRAWGASIVNESKRPDSIGREVLFEVDDRVAHVRLARPESRNAINGSVVRALAWIVERSPDTSPGGDRH